jgi:hypothetical protein
VRYRGQDGTWRKVRATTQQIIRRLSNGKAPDGLEACRQDQGDFRPLRDYPEFRAVVPRRRRAKAPPHRRRAAVPVASPAVPPPSRRRRGLLIGAAAVLLALAALAALLAVLFLGRP